MDLQGLNEMVQIYELLLMIGINRLLRVKTLENKDKIIY